MLPSRGIVRSLPTAGVRRQITSRHATTLGNGRQYGTLQRSVGGTNGLSSTSGFQLKTKQAVAPVVLGSVASTRNLSLWGYGKKAEDAATTTTTTATSTPAAEPTLVEAPVEKAAEGPSAVAAEATTTASSAPADAVQATDLSAITDLVNTTGSEILNRPEAIGYLSSLGLDYGWGPSSMMQWLLEHIHVWGGIGWAASIAAAAVVLRVAMIYPLIQSTKFSAQMKRMQEDPRFPEVNAKLKAAIVTGDRTAQAQAQALNSLLRREYNVPFKKMGWSFVPIPFSYGLFRVVTGMTHIPVPSLETSGFLWFSDLTQSDPYMLLPAVATGLMVLAIDLNARNTSANQAGMAKKMKYVLVPVMLFGTSFLSAAVNLMGVSFGAATLGTTVFLNNNSVRRAFGIPELKPPAVIPTTASTPGAQQQQPTYEAPRQPQSIREKLTSSFDETKKSISDSMSKMTGSAQSSVGEKAERKRKEQIRKLEEKRRQQERDHFEEKYKGKR